MAKKRMGKGLSALIPTDLEETIVSEGKTEKKKGVTKSPEDVTEIAVKDIHAASSQARRHFNDVKLNELASSIREHGILQPLLVREDGDGYRLVAGERRLRAAKKAELKTVPVRIVTGGDENAAEMGLIENLQREDLNAMEEATAYREMMDDFGHTQETLAKALGKSRSYIANALRLLSLDKKTRDMVRNGTLSAGHGRAILAVKAEPRRKQLRDRIVKEHLSVRQAEDLAKKLNGDTVKTKKPQKAPNEYYVAMEDKLRERFQTKVKISGDDKGGNIRFDYGSKEELERLLEIMIEMEVPLFFR